MTLNFANRTLYHGYYKADRRACSMTMREYQFLLADLGALDRLLAMTPESAVIDRLSLEHRRSQVADELARFPAEFSSGQFRMPFEIIFEVTEAVEGGYDARALGYSIFTQGDTWEDLKLMVQDAVRCYFDEDSVPQIARLHLIVEV